MIGNNHRTPNISVIVLNLGIIFVGCILSLVLLKFSAAPYILISIGWLLLFVLLFLVDKERQTKSIWSNLAFVSIVLGAIEVYSYLSIENQSAVVREYSQGYFTSDEILGYAPVKGQSSRSTSRNGQELIYDVTYTITESGLRISPPSNPSYAKGCLLFFGGSYTFGEGVEDSEVTSYVVASLSKLKVYNFGFHGYGPHQMLSAIEHEMVKNIANCKPAAAIYQALMTHVARSAGYSSWDMYGPKYVLQDEHLEYRGHFHNRIFTITQGLLKKSYLYRKFFKDRYTVSDQDVRLFLEIVEASRAKLIEKYPELKFHVLLWDYDRNEEKFQKMRDGLDDKSISYHLMSNILPEFPNDKSKYRISEFDDHPNSLAHRVIAEYIVSAILSMDHY